MFKRNRQEIPVPPKPGQPKPVEPALTPEQIEANRVIERGKRVQGLSAEAAMWRSFSTGCKAGRHLFEGNHYGWWDREAPPTISLVMDDDTAQLWRDFAVRMAEDRERRLRDVLGTV